MQKLKMNKVPGPDNIDSHGEETLQGLEDFAHENL